MKISIIIFLLGFVVNTTVAQKCDIAQAGIAVYDVTNSSPVTVIGQGEYAIFKFSVTNLVTGTSGVIPANSVKAIFDFPTLQGGIKPYSYAGAQTFVSGYFTWTYNSSAEALIGTNTIAIPNGAGDASVEVKVKGVSLGIGHSNLNLSQGRGISDNTSNNFSVAQLIVAAPVPVKLSSFTVMADRCNANLSWSTLSESNFKQFEIEYSPDAITYIKIATVKGKNLAAGADYKFGYAQVSGDGFYRLKLVDIDGRFFYSDVIHTRTTCTDQARIIIYPNPLRFNEKLMVDISGYQGKISGELFNEAGQSVKLYELNNGVNTLSVINLPAGVYMLYVKTESKTKETFKIVISR